MHNRTNKQINVLFFKSIDFSFKNILSVFFFIKFNFAVKFNTYITFWCNQVSIDI